MPGIAGESVEVRVGINTGEVLVRLAVDLTNGESILTGDAVNVAARLEAAAPPMAVAVGSATHDATENLFAYDVHDHPFPSGPAGSLLSRQFPARRRKMDHPRGLIEFIELYPTEEACAKAIFEHRWPEGFVCSRCGSKDAWHLRHRGLYECAHCHYQGSLTAGTVFQASRTDRARDICPAHRRLSQRDGRDDVCNPVRLKGKREPLVVWIANPPRTHRRRGAELLRQLRRPRGGVGAAPRAAPTGERCGPTPDRPDHR